MPPSLLGESPLWHPSEQVLYWCDIPGHKLNRFDPATGAHREWAFDTDVACCAPLIDGGLLLALRDGLVRFDPANGHVQGRSPRRPTTRRTNASTTARPTRRAASGSARSTSRAIRRALRCTASARAGSARWPSDITVSNGLAWSPDARTMYWADTKAHRIDALDFDVSDGSLSRRRVFAQFPVKTADQPLASYGGRPDGAAVDAEGGYWVAMFEGARLLRLAPDGAAHARSAAAGALPDHALLRRARPEDAVHHHLAREAAGRRTRARAAGRLCTAAARRCAGLPANFAHDLIEIEAVMSNTRYTQYASLKDRVVFISGGSSGIGAELVRAFAAQGAKVAFCGTRPDGGKRADRRVVAAGHAAALVRRRATCATCVAYQALLARAAAELGPVRVLVNNAGRDDRHKMEDVTPEFWDDRLALNLKHYFFAIQAVAPGMEKAGGGSVINMGSVSWMRGRPNLVGYTTAKAGILGLTRTLARELGPRNIRVNALVPGAIVTERQTTLHRDPVADQQFLDAQCLKIRLDSGHVARATLFLAADDSDGMTGQHVLVDAGIAQQSVVT